MASVLEAVIGTPDIPEVAITSPTAPGVTTAGPTCARSSPKCRSAHLGGFHYRFSTRVGEDMGRQIGEHVVKNFMQLVTVGAR